MGWPITPEALTGHLDHLDQEYGPAEIIVTENGASYSDSPGANGRVDDQRRIDYLRAHIAAVADARDAVVPVTGSFVWSILDNLEWISGYAQRFGLVWVDHATSERTPKQSARWYADVIAEHHG